MGSGKGPASALPPRTTGLRRPEQSEKERRPIRVAAAVGERLLGGGMQHPRRARTRTAKPRMRGKCELSSERLNGIALITSDSDGNALPGKKMALIASGVRIWPSPASRRGGPSGSAAPQGKAHTVSAKKNGE